MSTARSRRTGESQVNNSFFEPVDAAVAERTQTQRLVELLDLHRASLLKYVNRILNSAEDAEDVVQETCVRLMRVRDLWRGEREVRAFLFKIATNLARDELRRRRARWLYRA
jgi:RNA polymerase sigma factor (sigma-70 family)